MLSVLAGCFDLDFEEKVGKKYDYYFENDIEVYTIGDALDYVYINIDYEEDNSDYWQLPEETYNKGTGDCEDMCLLFMYLVVTKLDLHPMMIRVSRIRDNKKVYHIMAILDGVYYETTAGYSTSRLSDYWQIEWVCLYEQAIWMTYKHHDSVGSYRLTDEEK